jgi:hypothetical protein
MPMRGHVLHHDWKLQMRLASVHLLSSFVREPRDVQHHCGHGLVDV